MAKYSRKQDNISKRYKFILVCEGRITEVQYFRYLQDLNPNIYLDIYFPKASSPKYLLNKMKEVLKGKRTDKDFEAWIVMDRDEWNAKDIADIEKWASEKNHGLALSIPKFEYWLLLHYEDGCGLSCNDCKSHLDKYLKSKHIPQNLVIKEKIETAIINARKRDKGLNKNICKNGLPYTNVFILVEKILNV